MNRPVLIVFLYIFFVSCSPIKVDQLKTERSVDFIDPFIGTADDHGQTHPSAGVPFGMIKPGPDTDPGAHAGYNYSDSHLKGFSQTRFSGVGCNGAGGNLRILPFTGKVPETTEIDKTTEIAQAGYYSVILSNKIRTKITADRTSAIYKFIFPSSSRSGISIDFTSSFSRFIEEEHSMDGPNAVMGRIKCKCVCDTGSYQFFYYLRINKQPDSMIDQDGKLIWSFQSSDSEEIIVKVGLSSVNAALAKNNLETETGNKLFEELRQSASEKWEKLLSSVSIETENDSLKRLFYTYLYHASQTPFSISDHISVKEKGAGTSTDTSLSHFHGWSLWDTFRTKYPLFSILFPEQYKAMMSSLVNLYKQGKADWASDKEPFLTTRTEHSIIILLDAYQKGLLNESLESVLPFMIDEINQLQAESPDKLLEKCYDCWGISTIAKELSLPDVDEQFWEKSKEYQAVWKEKFLKPDDSFDIMHGDGLYEGTKWQYRWFVPYDPDWVVTTIGSKEKTIEELDFFFENNLFNIGNQPDIHVPFLYYYLGQPWKSQKLVHDILLEPTVNYYGTHTKWGTPYVGKVFKAQPEGYLKEMDDDAGTMSSWFVLASMGLYPVCPGTPAYWILAPVFDSVSINVGNGKYFIIKTKQTNEHDIYIQKVLLNNKDLDRSWINFDEIKRGGEMIVVLGSRPNKEWGNEKLQIE